jgi:taurine dioxygenase
MSAVVRELAVVPRHPAIGAEVRGLNLGERLDDASFARLVEIWMRHPVLVFPRQAIDDEQQIAFARRFGELEIHPSVAHRSSRHPAIYRVANVDEHGNILPRQGTAWQYLELTWLWHTDSSFRPVPSNGSILHGIEVPEQGGDTLFANMYAVWDALPAARQRAIEGLRVLHSHDAVLSRSRALSERADKGEYEDLPAVQHPLVRRHPITGRRSLFLSPHTMSGIVGWPDHEAVALLEELTAFATREDFVYRHRWQRDDVLMWDNRCTMHAVMPYDAEHARRIMHRTTIVGDEAPRA